MDPLGIKFPIRIKSVLDKLKQAGFEAYIVGGCLRDVLLGKDPYDWDIATSATPEEIREVFRGYRQLNAGLKHGTVAVLVDNEFIEITTYRIDGEYSDGRRPDRVFFTVNITEDLARRDFTINACAMGDNGIIDPFGGQKDLKERTIRCVGDPIDRFREDALRILRGIRFASVLGFTVEENTKRAMFKCKDLLKNISQERITDEFCKTLLGNKVYDTLLEFKDIIVFMVPEVGDMVGFKQHNRYHIYDVYQHTLKAVESIDRDISLRMAMFFHDIGKPSCFSLDQNQVGHFYGHAKVSAGITRKILKRMRFSNRDIQKIIELIGFHDRQIGLTSKSVKRLVACLGEAQFRRLLKVKKADAKAKNPIFLQDKLKNLNAIEKKLDDILAEDPCIALRDLAVNGKDLIDMGIPQGKKIGRILNKLLDMVINEELDNNREDLLKMVKTLSDT